MTAACPNCRLSYYWENTAPGQCDGCGYVRPKPVPSGAR